MIERVAFIFLTSCDPLGLGMAPHCCDYASLAPVE